MKIELLLTVESSFVLTGLGVLVRGAASGAQLGSYALHTALPVVLVYPDGTEAAAIGSVEEVSHSALVEAEPALLLQLPDSSPVPTGTAIWLAEPAPDDLYGGLL